MGNTAVINIDYEKDFVTGSLAVPGAKEILYPIYEQLTASYASGHYLIATRDRHAPNMTKHFENFPVHCVIDTPGAEIDSALFWVPWDKIFDKGADPDSDDYSGFAGFCDGQSLAEYLSLRNITHIILIGLAFDHCVKATALDGLMLGFDVTVNLDATAALTKRSFLETYAKLDEAGVKLVYGAYK